MRGQPVPRSRTSPPAWTRMQHTFQCTDGAGRTFTVRATGRNSFRSAVEATGRTMADVMRTVELTPR
jgi:hypothetical protein